MFRKFSLILILCLGLFSVGQAVMINEVLYDTQGTDDTGIMFTELWGEPGTNLNGWSLVGINGNGGVAYLTVNLSGTIPDDGYFVIGGAGVPNVDLVMPHDWQNAGSADAEHCDGLDLKQGATLIDHICYGVCTGSDVCSGEGGSNAPDPFPTQGINKSIARNPDHSDTNNNGTDFVVSDTPSPGAPNSGTPCVPVNASIGDLRENDGNGVSLLNGSFVITRGIVNVNNSVFDDSASTYYMQDDDAGINIFGGTPPQQIMEGDCVEVSGWVGQYNGLTEILSSGSGSCLYRVVVLNHVTPPAPSIITCGSFFEAFEGMLVRINNVSITNGSWPGQGQFANLTITDGQGTITLRVDDDTQVDGSPAPSQVFSVIGILTQFDNSSPYSDGYQITPRYVSDIISGTAADDEISLGTVKEFNLIGTYPNPFNSNTQIQFEVGNSRDLKLSIFDLLGREVLSENFSGLTPGAHTFNWSPAGSSGLYIVKLSSPNLTQTAKALYLK